MLPRRDGYLYFIRFLCIIKYIFVVINPQKMTFQIPISYIILTSLVARRSFNSFYLFHTSSYCMHPHPHHLWNKKTQLQIFRRDQRWHPSFHHISVPILLRWRESVSGTSHLALAWYLSINIITLMNKPGRISLNTQSFLIYATFSKC